MSKYEHGAASIADDTKVATAALLVAAANIDLKNDCSSNNVNNNNNKRKRKDVAAAATKVKAETSEGGSLVAVAAPRRKRAGSESKSKTKVKAKAKSKSSSKQPQRKSRTSNKKKSTANSSRRQRRSTAAKRGSSGGRRRRSNSTNNICTDMEQFTAFSMDCGYTFAATAVDPQHQQHPYTSSANDVTTHEAQDRCELVQESFVYYTLAASGVGRRLTINLDGPENGRKSGDGYSRPLPPGTFERRTCFQIPLPLIIPFWRRHDYSLSDIKTTLQAYKPRQNWQVAQSMGQTVATNATKVSYESEEDLICQAGATAVNNIMAALELEGNWSETTRLTYDQCDNNPPLPVHWVGPDDWAAALACLNTRTLATDPLTGLPIEHGCGRVPRAQYTHCLQWRDTRVVPVLYIRAIEPDPDTNAATTNGGGAKAARGKAKTTTTVSSSSSSSSSSEGGRGGGGAESSLQAAYRHNCEAEHDVIEMLRVVPERVYSAHCKRTTCLIQEPQRYMVGDSLCCAALESFYIAPATAVNSNNITMTT